MASWEKAKTRKVQRILLAYIEKMSKFPFSRSFQADNSSKAEDSDGLRRSEEILREMRAKLLEVVTEEEAEELIRKALDFRRMGPPRGGRSRRGGKHHREPHPFPAPDRKQPSEDGNNQSE